MSRSLPVLALVVATLAGGCFVLDRTAALEPGSVVGAATRPDLDGSPGASYVRVSGIGSSLVRVGDADGAFVVSGLGTGRLDLRLVDDVDGDGWPDRGRDVSIFVADDAPGGALGTVDVGALPLQGTFGLRGTIDLPAVLDDDRVARVYALRGRCADGDGNTGSVLDDGACADPLARLEHGVDGEAAVDEAGNWLLSRVIAGPIDVVAVLHEKNADGSLGRVIDVTSPLPFDGVATDAGDLPLEGDFGFVFDDVSPPVVSVQLSLSRAAAGNAFAAVVPLRAVVPDCAQIRDAGLEDTDIIEIDAGSTNVVGLLAAGAWSVVVCDDLGRGTASSFVAVPSDVNARWPVVMLDDDVNRCPLDPTDPADADRDCDGNGVRGLPLATIESLRTRCAAECFPDATQPFDSLGVALGARTCTVDDDVYDCDDDGDGQPDVTEPAACIGTNRGSDLDGDGLCSIVDSFPYCPANTAAACPAGAPTIVPRVPVAAGSGVVRGPVGAVVTVAAGEASVVVEIDTPSIADGATLVYGEAAFTLAAAGTITVTPGDAVPSLVCAVVTSTPLVIGCEHGFDHLVVDGDVVGTFFDGTEVVVGGLPADGDDGRYVAFASSANIAGNTGGVRQVFWRDRGTGVTHLVSAVDGVPGTARSEEPAISADGLTVAFTTTNAFVVDDVNGTADIYLWRAAAPDVLERVSVAENGTEGDGVSDVPSLDGDGDVIAFASTSSTFTGGVAGISTVNVFRKDLVTGVVTLLSARAEDGVGVGGDNPAISFAGDRVAFYSFAATIVDGDDNGLWDVFVADVAGATKRVSLTAAGTEREQGDESASRIITPAISGDGRFVGWATTAGDVVADDLDDTQDVFITNVDTGEVVCASDGSDDDSPRGQGERPSLSADGRFVAFSSVATGFGAVAIRDLQTGELHTVVAGDVNGVGVPAISAGGSVVVVGSGTELDARVDSTGTYAVFTNLAPAWWWTR